MRIFGLIIVSLALLGAAVWSQEPPVTKIVVRAGGPKIPAESYMAKPKTFYLAGDKYARIEQELDPERGVRPLIITNEPNMWIVNLMTKTAQHIVDHESPFEFHAPIVYQRKTKQQPESNPEFKGLNFGNEIQFFREQNPRDLGQRQLDGKNFNVLALKKGSIEVSLFVDPATGQPYQLDVVKEGKPSISFRYLEYKTNLPFQKSLFEPPDGVKISDAN
jgi:outer membrane lipoprotein-sorting protein